jgi:hypothetical protein
MYRHSKTISYIIFGLIAIGLLANIQNLWIPLLIFGIVFYLYKFPPKQFQRGQKYNTRRPTGRPKSKPKKSMFRVIKGNKKDNDDPPKYH